MSNSSWRRREFIQLAPLLAAAATWPQTLLARQIATALPDRRLAPLKDLDGDFSWTPSPTLAEWNVRAAEVRRRILVSQGLWPMPPRPRIQATVHSPVERVGYAVSRVFFESSPGLFVTGSLYVPAGRIEPGPAVLCPHGHWQEGRFYEHTAAQFEAELATGSESDPVCGRYPLQARCVQLARMGCVVFFYDMLGYADSLSFTQQLAHGFAKQRPEASSPDDWGLFSAQSELRQINAMGLQTWNSLCAFDWLSSLPTVDPQRIGVTGASGGGTQTFILGAIDPRPAALFPAVMVSTEMQGGCTCENASHLRVETGNIEFAALIAPRPLAMTGADDWTRFVSANGLPQLKQHYALWDKADHVEARYFEYPHNYNQTSRGFMYQFMNRALNLGIAEPIVEQPFVPLTRDEMTVWSNGHAAPNPTLESERALLHAIAQRDADLLAALTPSSPASFHTYQQVIGGAWDTLIGRRRSNVGTLELDVQTEATIDGVQEIDLLLRNTTRGECTPFRVMLPTNWALDAVLWLDEAGRDAIDREGTPTAILLKRGMAVVALDVFLTGLFVNGQEPPDAAPVVKNPREFVGYTLGYNASLFAQRVHDVLALGAFATTRPVPPRSISLAGQGVAGAWAAAAAAQSEGQVKALAVDLRGFCWRDLTHHRDPHLVPGALKYGDIGGLVALHAPKPLYVAGLAEQDLARVQAAYRSLGAMAQLTVSEADPTTRPIEMANWLAQSNRP